MLRDSTHVISLGTLWSLCTSRSHWSRNSHSSVHAGGSPGALITLKKSKGNINYLFFIPVELEVYKTGLVKISYFVLQKLQIQFKLLISPKDNSTPRLCIFGAKSAPFTRCRL